MRRGRCAADTQNHTALQRARNRSKKLILRVLFAKELGCIISQYVGNVHQLAGITADTNGVTSIRQRLPRPVSTSPTIAKRPTRALSLCPNQPAHIYHPRALIYPYGDELSRVTGIQAYSNTGLWHLYYCMPVNLYLLSCTYSSRKGNHALYSSGDTSWNNFLFGSFRSELVR